MPVGDLVLAQDPAVEDELVGVHGGGGEIDHTLFVVAQAAAQGLELVDQAP